MSKLAWTEVMNQLSQGHDLTVNQAYDVMDSVMSGELGEIRLSAFLAALRAKGEAVTEVRGLADAMQNHARPIDVPTDVLDIVGTGGDGARTVNISTMASMVIASTGVPVVKHGNRASTSACGSADVLEALGVNLDLEPDEIARIFDDVGIAFLFANLFHPSMRYAASVRRELGFPTVFNILGPMTNPAKPQSCAIGVSRRSAAELMAGVFASRGTNALVFHGAERGLDELTTIEPAEIWAVEHGEITRFTFDPRDALDMKPARVDDLRGGDAQENATAVTRTFAGNEGPIRDAVTINAAAGIVAFSTLGSGDRRHTEDDLVSAIQAAHTQACEAIDTGRTTETLNRWVTATARG
ncbi:MAG: anthranilate phosphoribosyltransferase [Actinomycetaceae bacterium]|nr:anthranilate phosphoribosyltransferase [Actinomycetaceae bacterium]